MLKIKKIPNNFISKRQIILKLHQDKFIDDMVLWNLLSSKFKKSEVEEIDKTFRKHFKKKIVTNE